MVADLIQISATNAPRSQSQTKIRSVARRHDERSAVYGHILIATDGSELAEKALAHGLALAKAVGARATAVTVTEP